MSAKAELYSITTYDMEGNFVTSTTDNDGNITSNHYNEKTGQLLDSILPSRQVVNVDTKGNVSRTEKAVQVTYDYDHDHDDRLVGISQFIYPGEYNFVSNADYKKVLAVRRIF